MIKFLVSDSFCIEITLFQLSSTTEVLFQHSFCLFSVFDVVFAIVGIFKNVFFGEKSRNVCSNNMPYTFGHILFSFYDANSVKLLFLLETNK